jgi:molybdopterin/thiamine biosynthesis adenylyltransferase
LAKAGIGQLVLVDDDSMLRENLFRHVLGTDTLGERKASALAKAVRRAAPYCEAKAHVLRVERLLEEKPRVVEEADLVILATGDPGVDLRVSDALRHGRNPPLVATWVEPLGLGGHVFAAGRDSACLRCLYDDTQQGMTNRSSFATPHQDYAANDAGCGGAHTPFSNSDAVRTADLAVQSAIALLKNPEQEPLLRSWKGDASAFLSAGYTTTPRFESSAVAVGPEPCAPCSTCGSSTS